MSHPLGRWSVLDIETSGLNPEEESIIDLGYLQFEGTKLIKTFDSLVKFPMSAGLNTNYSKFTEKLTGISKKMLSKAPLWEEVKVGLLENYGQHIVAHNARFEKSFLERHFDEVDDGTKREDYQDSLFYLALLFPGRTKLNLESFICEFNLADHEMHRGFQDSLDLLKVLLLATSLVQENKKYYQSLITLFNKYYLNDYWFYHFLTLEESDLLEISDQIDFDLDKYKSLYKEKKLENTVDEVNDLNWSNEFSGKNISSILQNEEKVKSKIPAYNYRKPQESLALKVGQCFKNDIHALVQAPTGTGKTLGYMLPASLFAVEEKKKVLIATGTKTLQNQAISKDVPQLNKLLGSTLKDLKVSQLVGSSNHFCELLFRETGENSEIFSASKDFDEKFCELYFDLLFMYNAEGEITSPLTRVDIPYSLKMNIKNLKTRENEIAVDYRSCTGSKCPFKGSCTYLQGLKEAKESDIIIGNHSLMFTWPRAFPRPEYVIVDEAHRIEHEITSSFGHEITNELLKQFIKNLQHMQGVGSLFYIMAQLESNPGDSTETITKIRSEVNDFIPSLIDHTTALPDLLEDFFKRKPRFTEKYWNELPMINKTNLNQELPIKIFNEIESLFTALVSLQKTLASYAHLVESAANIKGNDNLIIAVTRFETFTAQLDDLCLGLEKLLDEDSSDYCRTLKFHAEFGISFCAHPINAGKVLHDNLLETSSSVVFTSATLANDNGSEGSKGIEWATGYLYTDPDKRFKGGFYLPAIYDYQNKTKILLCDDTPALYDSSYIPTVLGNITQLVKELNGRSLLLFSAKSRFEAAREYLLNALNGDLPLFIQGMGNNVIEEFKESGEGVLLGMETFGEGIDIPGDSLSFIFIDKVPDLRMDLVIQERRDFYSKHIGNEFVDYYLAHRTRSLHQKLGRLLRTKTDEGAVVIVDSRIKRWKGRTMQQFYDLMRPYNIHRTNLSNACQEVKEFLIK
ncbi:MAG: hypothetical protein HOJ35_07910 [Bdellovibrionales bacterium]|jgi:ATP-dependent DNA helicase DinG|nr:hypothetical protein [Bdellovibrionales bacterium]